MWKVILRRILLMIPELVILSLLVFLLAKLMPGDPFTGMVTPQTAPEQIEALRVQSGFYDPWYVQYYNWIVRMFHGDLGMSYQFKTPVGSLILSRMGNTLWLSLMTLILSYALAIPLGLVAGRYENTKLDKGIMIYTFVAYAIPSFVFYLLGVWFFGYKLRLFPTSGSVSVEAVSKVGYFLSRLDHMILPACLMALLSVTAVVQYLRSEVIDNKNQDYVRTAQAKGVTEKKVFTNHIFRNSLLPIAAFLGYSITGLLGGSIFIEQIFNYPGMGLLFMDSIMNRDYSVITDLVLLYGILTLIGSLLSILEFVLSKGGEMMKKNTSNFAMILREFKQDKGATFFLLLLLAMILFIYIDALFLNTKQVMHVDILNNYLRPGKDGHLLGTDQGGRDVFHYLILGTRTRLISVL